MEGAQATPEIDLEPFIQGIPGASYRDCGGKEERLPVACPLGPMDSLPCTKRCSQIRVRMVPSSGCQGNSGTWYVFNCQIFTQ